MSGHVKFPQLTLSGDYCVPGTCFTPGPCVFRVGQAGGLPGRNAAWRRRYLGRALAEIPRLLGAIDRNPFRETYGCLDRQFWHYRTASFPSQMYQEGVLPLALAYAVRLPGNRWYANPRVRELAVAGMRFAARASHADGSCDDYYPFERALGAAVFSLTATTRAYQLLRLSDPELVRWFRRRARWLVGHDESGRLANHQALAALGLLHVWQITGDESLRRAADARVEKVLHWQSTEGWFDEYGGADPGYQTVTIDCLAKYRRATGDGRLDEPLRRAVAFAHLFLHPDQSYGGPYGSRGTCHFYPHGMELLAKDNPQAAELADGFLASLAAGTEARFDDDRMFAHRLGNLIEAYVDWSPAGVAAGSEQQAESTRYLPEAGMLVRRSGRQHTVISAARGGTFVHFDGPQHAVSDAGLIVQTDGGRVAVSQCHDPARQIEVSGVEDPAALRAGRVSLCVRGPLHWRRFDTATPLKQAAFHAGMLTAGRWCRGAVRRLLQRRLITGRRECPIQLTRRFEFLSDEQDGACLRVTDTIELTSPAAHVRRMAFGSDHESAYVAASGVYQQAAFSPWTDLASQVDELNARRRVTVVRRF